ncbi:hypothetical protein KORDIASMS9_04134 [Kordia sp. SMS9]|uniref:DUF3857 domain-containing protein n=1 Tax=Kordia sp. SMS9 TaxID=2282170 RepID=UPI000E0CDBE3|nr:DUF3857 domain-containing protein [Kordia sp. SMS9]AXG71876.1 hypothetical protein KORDIASMS9_04134 [Kordia sp. SMS9]
MRAVIVILLCLCTTQAFSQYYKKYDWAKKPKLHELSEKEANESSIAILEKYVVEFVVPKVGDQIKKFETTHTIARVHDEKGLKTHNTVYISMYDVMNIVDIKARTISPDGKVTMLNKDNIKEVKNVEEYGDFKIFAIEGAVKDSEIEVLYTLEKEYSAFGRETLQKSYPIKRLEYNFIYGTMAGRVKAYNASSDFTRKSYQGNIGRELILENIVPMIEEEYATPNSNKTYIAYQCFGPGTNVTDDMLWSNVVTNITEGMFPSTVHPEIAKIAKTILKDQKTDDFTKAFLIDDYVKTNYTIVQNNNAQLSDIDYIVKNKSASDLGIIKVYSHLLEAANVEYLPVITADVYEFKFDAEFFNPTSLREFLIYIPKTYNYITPNRVDYRLSEIPPNILGNTGIFVNDKKQFSFYKIKQKDPDYSRVVRNVNISFEEDLEYVKIDQQQQYYGHWAMNNRAYLNLAPEQAIKEFEDYLTGSGIEDKVVKKYEVTDKEMLQLEYNKPFLVNSTITSESILEEAGDSYIFQVGKVIGTQSELYQETERVNPIQMQYPNRYNYEIVVNIPTDYEVEGLESLIIMKELLDEEGSQKCKFESNYTLKGNKIIITIEEFYKEYEYDIAEYEGFREVINAASDFNKAAILMNPKE